MLKAKTTYNKTICLPEKLYQRWVIFAALHDGRESFNGFVIKHLDATLPHLDAQKEAQP